MPLRAALMLFAVLTLQSHPAFEVASVKPVAPGARASVDVRFEPARFLATALTLEQLIEQAYGIASYQLSGVQGWMEIDRFDVTAATPGGAPVAKEQMQLMLRQLLTDRFHLKIAPEMHQGTVYSLTAVGTPKGLTAPADPRQRPLIVTQREDANGKLSYIYQGENATTAMLAQTLAQQFSAAVYDQTGIQGNWDFQLRWALEEPFGGLEPDPNVPSIFTALESELHLKLTASKGLVPVYVVQSATRPTPN